MMTAPEHHKHFVVIIIIINFFIPQVVKIPGVKNYKIIIIIYYLYMYFLTPVLNSQGMKKLRYAIQKKYKNQAGMNLTPPPPSQNSHAVRWHCTAESERRVAEIKS